MFSYNDQEYQLLQLDNWTKQETDHLFDLCRQFDLRFTVIQDRWDVTRFSKRSIEDLKERYYDICNIINKVKLENNNFCFVGKNKIYVLILGKAYRRTRAEEYCL